MENKYPLILHIGYPRTATTLFQTALQKHNPSIRYLGRSVEGRDGKRWHSEQLFLFWEWIRLGRGSVNADTARSFVDSLLEEARQEGKVAAVISDETMSKPHRLDWHGGMVERLQSIFPDAEILLTLRNQVDVTTSMYGLYITRCLGSALPALTFSQWFLQGSGSSYVPLVDRFNYAAMYKPLLDAFGKERIHLLLFEELRKDHSTYLSKLSDILRCRPFIMPNDVRVNSSPDLRNNVNFIRKLSTGIIAKIYENRWLAPAHGILDNLLLSDKKIKWDQYAPDDESRRLVAHLFFDSNDLFAEMSGIDLTGAGYPTLANMRERYIYYRG